MAQVVIRNRARKRLETILECAYVEYGRTTLERFLKEIEHIDQRLSTQPKSYPIEPLLGYKKKEYRGCILKKNFKLIYYYQESTDTVYISTVWDMRMSPEKLLRDF